ncbi:uncharacterized protein MYCFIDRAFT_178160 [Pseudocercospora fijiensis CIRAD86]|uniref:Uncharacterized protein n=1 Tax=Pseudocercospora fijiensis (strain CIRAD86) TaxID=383855 RepID=M2ZKF3_PSEFD|nr:uncharacterized protein MYCFIDRAFT_178160 [Pseudocercospora fijiensis CIRAD86]EME79569.1 hypothetical protein MYCFIDRAFT_178160 [Pseudocercospora fijiensis CIRAD86]
MLLNTAIIVLGLSGAVLAKPLGLRGSNNVVEVRTPIAEAANTDYIYTQNKREAANTDYIYTQNKREAENTDYVSGPRQRQPITAHNFPSLSAEQHLLICLQIYTQGKREAEDTDYIYTQVFFGFRITTGIRTKDHSLFDYDIALTP